MGGYYEIEVGGAVLLNASAPKTLNVTPLGTELTHGVVALTGPGD